MRQLLLEIVAILALLGALGNTALADGPGLAAQPDVRPDANGSTAGGSAAANGGSAGPATFATSQPITGSSSNTTAQSGPSQSSTSAQGPGTTATAPVTTATTQPDPSAADGSAPTPSGPTANADTSQTNVSSSDSRVRANLRADVTGAFGGSAAGIGSAQDPTRASTCSTAEASPGVPTDASLGTMCGDQASSASESLSANGADGSGTGGGPAGAACFTANASAGPSPTSSVGTPCTTQDASPTAFAAGPGESGAGGVASSPGETATQQDVDVLGFGSLPSTTTASASVGLLGGSLVLAGFLVLQRSRRKLVLSSAQN